MDKYSHLVVGAGLSGATVARVLADKGIKVLVIEQRDHIGGNVYDYIYPETNIRVSKYGAHIFHTNSDKVWQFVNRFSDWLPYQHRVLSYVDDQYVPVPVNKKTVEMLLGQNARIESEQFKIENVQNSKDAALNRVGQKLYDLMFKPYTKKQWDLYPEQLEPSVLERIPVRYDYNDRYFSDKYEALPKDGYTAFVQNILDHPNIKVMLNTEYNHKQFNGYKATLFTGKVDGYFDNKFGKLQYRSLDFEYQTIDSSEFQQPTAVVNYPSLDYPWTRIIDYKQFYNTQSNVSVIAYEFSKADGHPYYPIPTPKNRELYSRYQAEAQAQQAQGLYFVGRLAEYKYYNMDQAILSALNTAEDITN